MPKDYYTIVNAGKSGYIGVRKGPGAIHKSGDVMYGFKFYKTRAGAEKKMNSKGFKQVSKNRWEV